MTLSCKEYTSQLSYSLMKQTFWLYANFYNDLSQPWYWLLHVRGYVPVEWHHVIWMYTCLVLF